MLSIAIKREMLYHSKNALNVPLSLMNKKRFWFWIVLFVSLAGLLGALATGWNFVLVKDYEHILTLAKNLSTSMGERSIEGTPNIKFRSSQAPRTTNLEKSLTLQSEIRQMTTPHTHLLIKMILGTLGFIITLGLAILLFIKLLSEMRLNQVQSEFLAAVSHELKTPIAALELSASLLQSGDLSQDEIKTLWGGHKTELRRLKEEVEILLKAARSNSKSVLNKKTSFCLESWINESFSDWKAILGPHASLFREGDPLGFEVRLDLRDLNLVIHNLLSNAKKFSKEMPHVTIRTKYIPKKRLQLKSKWQIQLVDQGWGFDPQDSKKIFQRFFRSKNKTPYAIPGTGLGLFLAQDASKAMGLTLKGESTGTGYGAVFTLEGTHKQKIRPRSRDLRRTPI